MNIQQAAIGLDLGSFKAVITAAKKGGVDVVCNEANFRETPVIVGFGGEERNIGEAGQNKYKSNVKDTMVYPTRFLGLVPSSPELAEESKFVLARSSAEQEVLFHFTHKGSEVALNA
jgi:heat shock protein 4